MDLIVSLIPLLKILLVFICMLAGIRFKLGVGPSILIGAVTLAPLTSMGANKFIQASGAALIDSKTLFLAIIIALIMILSGLLEQTGQAARIMESLTGYLRSPRLRLVFFPALIGLLPMPGGAIFSAPMIQEASGGLDVSSRDKAVLNYWFRHVWELSWPLYPGMILAAALCSMSIFQFISYTYPGTLACIGLGCFFFLRPSVLPMKNNGKEAASELPKQGINKIVIEGLPLITAIVGALFFEMALAVVFPDVPFEVGIILALIAAVACAIFANKGAVSLIINLLLEKRFLNMIFMILCVFIFKDILGASGLVDELSRMAGGEAALIAAAVLIPYLVGFISGITMAFVGSAMPLVVGLVHASGLSEQLPAWAVLCMFSGFAGIMSSPLHICFLLTCEYFKVDMYSTWKKVAMPSIMLMLLGVAYFFILL